MSDKSFTRPEYQATHGFALFTDVNTQHLDFISKQGLDQLPATNVQYQALMNPAVHSLYSVVNQITSNITNENTFNASTNTRSACEITDHDDKLARRHHTFDGGFGDLSFPWFFSAYIAAATTNAFVEGGHISPQERNMFSLNDWANVIGSGWFSRLMHNAAYTRNGIYGVMGKHWSHYGERDLDNEFAGRRMIHQDDRALEVVPIRDPHDGKTYLTAKFAKPALKSLRHQLSHYESAGCPVARYSTYLPEERAYGDKHLMHMVKLGEISLVACDDRPGTVRVTQEYSAIDKTLMLLANMLGDYQNQYGTPLPVRSPKTGQVTLIHQDVPDTDAHILKRS